MPRAEDYRRLAAECLAIAQRATTAGDRVRLLELAHAFNELAAKLFAERENQTAPDDGENESD